MEDTYGILRVETDSRSEEILLEALEFFGIEPYCEVYGEETVYLMLEKDLDTICENLELPIVDARNAVYDEEDRSLKLA